MVQLFPEETRITLTRGLYDYKACFYRSMKSLITLVCWEVDNLQVNFWFISSLRFFASGFFSIFRRLRTPNVFYSTLLQALRKFRSYYFSALFFESSEFVAISSVFLRFAGFYDSIHFAPNFPNYLIRFDSFRRRFDSIRLI